MCRIGRLVGRRTALGGIFPVSLALLLHSIGDDLGETVPGNRNTMPGDGSRRLTMGLLELLNLDRRHFVFQISSEIPHVLVNDDAVPTKAGTVICCHSSMSEYPY